MSVSIRQHRLRVADYVRVERDSLVKHEFIDGEIYAMSGGTPLHAALAAAVTAHLSFQLRGKRCRAYSSDLRVRVPGSPGNETITYPDVTVICHQVVYDTESRDTAVNPSLVVEVLSDSTMNWDLGEKFERYKQISELKGVVYVWQSEQKLELRARQPDGTWTSHTAGVGQTLEIESLGCRLPVDDIYEAAGFLDFSAR